MNTLSPSPPDADHSPSRDHTASPSKKFTDDRKRFQHSLPALFIDAEGRLLHMTDAARHLLEYEPEDAVDGYFFTHVHGKNLPQVMRDLAHMVKRGKERASWMLRLRTGKGHWRWYKAEAKNKLHTSVAAISVRLRHLYHW